MLHRRDVLRGAAGLAGAAAVVARTQRVEADVGPFRHGVASGDPLADRVVLWTRVSGVPGGTAVAWLVAADRDFASVVAQGEAVAEFDADFTVKVDASGLAPATVYWYRFEAGGARSAVGRTRTAPAGATPSLTVGVVSCADYGRGFFSAYRRLSERQVDVVVHLGDYIYESTSTEAAVAGRAHEPGGEVSDLAGYRARYAQYHTDPDLQRLHQSAPMVPIWDDHEICNNTWRDGAGSHQPDTEGPWEERRDAAVQAWFEWLPVRPTPDRNIYRHLPFGDLVDVIALDTRLEGRDQQVSPEDDDGDATEAVADPGRRLISVEQFDWLRGRLQASQASTRWRLLMNQVMLAQLPLPDVGEARGGSVLVGERRVNPDQWDGYGAERARLFDLLDELGTTNLVVATGDFHSSWAAQVTRDPDNADIPLLGAEFVTPSISASAFARLVGASGAVVRAAAEAIQALNPHIEYVELERHGYVVLTITPEQVQADWWHVPPVEEPSDTESFDAGWLVVDGDLRLRPVDQPAPQREAGDPLPEPADDTTTRVVDTLRDWGPVAGGMAVVGGVTAGVVRFRRRQSRP